jgi:hypothetical protein
MLLGEFTPAVSNTRRNKSKTDAGAKPLSKFVKVVSLTPDRPARSERDQPGSWRSLLRRNNHFAFLNLTPFAALQRK